MSDLRVKSLVPLPEVLLVEPAVWADRRGYFFEAFTHKYLAHGIGPFVQDNFSVSHREVLRGLHLQSEPNMQGKLLTVVRGAAFDVVVDVRIGSPTFGLWGSVWLDETKPVQVWVPAGFAHGFCALDNNTVLQYKTTAPYEPSSEIGIAWNDVDIGIAWPMETPTLSDKDRGAPSLRDVRDRLPRFVCRI